MLIEGIKICVSVKLKHAVKSVKWSVTGKHESPIRDFITQSSCSYPRGEDSAYEMCGDARRLA